MINKAELPACPVETTLMLIGDKWKVLILRDLIDGTKRFGELKRSVTGISQKVLTSTSVTWRKTACSPVKCSQKCRQESNILSQSLAIA